MTPGLVSVIVPSYNKIDHLRETIESILSQEGVQAEVVLVDDRSSDGSWEVAEEFGERIRRHRLPENSGAPRARNIGAELSRGDYLMFLDADDILGAGTLAALRRALADHNDALALCRWRSLRRLDGEWTAVDHGKELVTSGDGVVHAWLANRYFPPCAMLWCRETYLRSGGWDESLLAWQDTDIVLRTVLRGVPLILAGEGESFYRFNPRGSSVSSRPGEAAVRSRVRVLDKLEAEADRHGSLDRHRLALGRAYYELARSFAEPYPALVLECLRKADRLLRRRALSGSLLHRLVGRVLGLERKARLKQWWVDSAKR